jgi:hypothetical protein
MTGPRPFRLLLLAVTLLGGAACASDDKRDQFYNTDVGANWVPDDGSVIQPHDAAVDQGAADGRDGGVRDAGGDAVDGGDAAAVDAAGEG